MTIQNTGLRKEGPILGNGAATALPFTFKVFAPSDVLVTYLNAASVESTLALAVDYSIILNADQNTSPGGTVTLFLAHAYGTSVTLTSNVSNTQNLSLTNAGGFYPASINDALDRCVIQIQQLAEQLTRTFKVPISSVIIAGTSVADYLSAAATSALAAATSANSSAASASQSAGFFSTGSLSALSAAASAAAAAASASAATTPNGVVLAAYADTFMPPTPPVTFTSIYVGGGWDMGTIVLAAPFTNEASNRRVNLSLDSAATFNYGTVP